MSGDFDCPQCGEATEALHEGYCADCCADNQARLDAHKVSHDRWALMTNDERDREIRWATR